MNVSLPDTLREFVDEQVATGNYGTHSEYVRELIRRERDRLRLREALLQGAESAPSAVADDAFFDRLRARTKPPRAAEQSATYGKTPKAAHKTRR